MDKAARRNFLGAYGPGLLVLILAYMLFTAARDFRDNFAAELWRELGRGDDAGVFALSEVPVAVIALIALGAMIAIRGNRTAFFLTHWMMALGAAAVGLATFAFQLQAIDGLVWMIIIGAGLYVFYTPYNSVLFERLIAASRHVGMTGFRIYLADACDYVASVGLLLYKNFGAADLDWVSFFMTGAYITSVLSLVLVITSAVYFRRKLPD
jgi:hypothetical protein